MVDHYEKTQLYTYIKNANRQTVALFSREFVAVVNHFYFPLLHRSSILDQIINHEALT